MEKICRSLKEAIEITFDKYNYEKFMIDFINDSKLVDEKKGASFCHQEEQSNSEADASNGFYDIDFDLIDYLFSED